MKWSMGTQVNIDIYNVAVDPLSTNTTRPSEAMSLTMQGEQFHICNQEVFQ